MFVMLQDVLADFEMTKQSLAIQRVLFLSTLVTQRCSFSCIFGFIHGLAEFPVFDYLNSQIYVQLESLNSGG